MNFLSKDENRSRKILLSLFLLFLILDVIVIFISKEYFSGVIRLGLTIVLMYYVISGYVWAKWVLVVCCILAFLICLVFGIYFIPVNVYIGFGILFFGFLILLFVMYLVKNKNVNQYFMAARQNF